MTNNLSPADQLKLILVTNKGTQNTKDYLNFVTACVLAGVSAVQLREKTLFYDQLFNFALQLRNTLQPLNTPLIINDDWRLCLEINADGVHLGQSDGDILQARKALGPEKLIGQSVDWPEQIPLANQLPLNYIGIGAIFPTSSKTNVSNYWGIGTLKTAVEDSLHPVVAIGGITELNASAVFNAGASGIALISTLHHAKNLQDTVFQLLNNTSNTQ